MQLAAVDLGVLSKLYTKECGESVSPLLIKKMILQVYRSKHSELCKNRRMIEMVKQCPNYNNHEHLCLTFVSIFDKEEAKGHGNVIGK